jgi:tRNA(Ile)-lysidine synthetase-like protein
VKDTEISHEHLQLLHRLVAGRQGSQEISLPRSLKIRREYDELIFIAPHQRNITQSVGCDEEVVLPPAGTTPQYLAISAMLFRFSLVPAIVAKFDNRAITFLDVNKIAPPLFFRRWHVGDRMNPLGMNNQSRKVQDIFTDKKIPRQERQLLPLLHDQAGILWIPNIALSERARVTEQSQELLKIEIMRSDDTV